LKVRGKLEEFYLVFDMGKLSFAKNGSSELVVVCENSELYRVSLKESLEETSTGKARAVYEVLDSMLAHLKVPVRVDGVELSVPVGVYNPYSCQVGLRAVPKTVVFSDFEELLIPAGGSLGRVEANGEDFSLQLAGRTLRRSEQGSRDVARALKEHVVHA